MEKKYKGFLIDLDGTIYKGTERIETAIEFVKVLHKKGLPYLFVTNNSSRKPEQVAEKLRAFGVPAEPEQVFTTSMATANFISEQKPGASTYFIGEEGLEHALLSKSLSIVEESPDYVIVGLDRNVSYEKFAKACLGVRNGATFISTNGDVSIPTERGFLPGNGSLTSVVTVSTGVQPLFIGKPERILMDQALEKLGVSNKEALMIGDNYPTDILAGINADIDTLLVFTGVTTKDKLPEYDRQPTHIAETLLEWIEKI